MRMFFALSTLAVLLLSPFGFIGMVGAESPAFFELDHDTIPNFAKNPTIQSTQNGSWSAGTTWGPARLPQAEDVVLIKHEVIYDSTGGVADTIGIDSGGALRFRTDQNTLLRVGTLLIMPGGELEVGTETTPVTGDVTAEILIKDQPLDLADDGVGIFDPEQYGTSLLVINGTITMHGSPKSTFMRLSQEPLAGSTTLTLEQSVIGWKPGDRLTLPDTRQLKFHESGDKYIPQWEELFIASISSDARTITLTAPLQFDHRGARDGNGTLRFLPHVANLTRNVVVRSENPAGTRGHTQAFHRAEVDIRYVRFQDLGRTTIDPLDNTKFDQSGTLTHIGTNQIARYPVHTHHVIGPETTPPNGYQFTLIGNAIDGGSNTHQFKWGMTIHGSHYGLIQKNVVYNMSGAGIAFEDGSESFNVLEKNFVMRVPGTGNRADSSCGSDCGREGVAFWFHGPNNYVRDNVAANTPHRYGYTIFVKYVGDKDIPTFKGADPHLEGQSTRVHMNKTPLLEFARNEVYGASGGGMTYWWIGTTGGTANAVAESTIQDFRVWHVKTGIYGYQSHRMCIAGAIILGDKDTMRYQATKGMTFSDYIQQELMIEDAEIQNMRIGIHAPLSVGPRNQTEPGVTVIQNSYLRNYYGIEVNPPWDNNNVIGLSPTELRIHNTRFEAMNVPPLGSSIPSYPSIYMNHEVKAISHLIQSNTVYVYDYNQVPNENFQVFFNEQHPDFIVPQTTYKDSGAPQTIGSPEAGLTNTQNWQTHGIAIAGSPASCLDDTSKPEIKGYTCPGVPPNGSQDTTPPQAPIGLVVM